MWEIEPFLLPTRAKESEPAISDPAMRICLSDKSSLASHEKRVWKRGVESCSATDAAAVSGDGRHKNTLTSSASGGGARHPCRELAEFCGIDFAVVNVRNRFRCCQLSESISLW